MPNENIDNLIVKKVKYKMSPSLLNSWIYYLENPSKATLESFEERLNNIYKQTPWMDRGLKFEEEVFEGKHGTLSTLVSPLQKQRWANKVINFEDFDVLISGKLDVYDKVKKRIYDIKRVNDFSANKYDTSTQHILYFYLMPEAKEFYYLLGVGPDMDNDPSKLTYPIIRKTRPDNLDDIVLKYVNDFIAFLNEQGLWEIYTKNQKAKR